MRSHIVCVLCVFLIAGCGRESSPKGDGAPKPPEPKAGTATTQAGMVLVPAGEFIMGDDSGEDDEKPAHKVKVGAFYIDAREVTQKSYEDLMGKNPSKHKGPDSPVEQLGWLGAIRYCNMRSRRDGLEPCYDEKTGKCNFDANGYRLPTEAEWEYACRAGTATEFSFGSDPGKLTMHAWFKDNANKTSHPAGQKTPNPWGLYDMHGNVWEWCNDIYSDAYDPKASENPTGPAAGEERVLRGGGWNVGPESCRSSARYSEPPGLADVCFGYDAYGFRCVRKATDVPPRR
ncbi:MAG: formylglycine-generating enzyme family protein [Planctomycetota bacterium]